MLEKISDIAGGQIADADFDDTTKLEVEDAGSSFWTNLQQIRRILPAAGTFTPTIVGNSVSGVGTYSTQIGKYLKIGQLVWVEISLAWSAHTGSGDLTIGGFPFTSTSVGDWQVLNIVADHLTFSGQLIATIDNNSTVIRLQTMATGAGIAAVALDSSASLIITGVVSVG